MVNYGLLKRLKRFEGDGQDRIQLCEKPEGWIDELLKVSGLSPES